MLYVANKEQYEVELAVAVAVDPYQECDSSSMLNKVDPMTSIMERTKATNTSWSFRVRFLWRVIVFTFSIFLLAMVLLPKDHQDYIITLDLKLNNGIENQELSYEHDEHDEHPSTSFTRAPPTYSRVKRKSSIKFGSPFIVLTEGGCSGTTSIGHYIRMITSIHGYHKTKGVTFEFLNADQYNTRSHKYKNRYYQDIVKEQKMTQEERIENHNKIIMESIKRAQKVAIESKSLLIFKAAIQQYEELHSELDDLNGGVTYAGVYRENILDRCTCMVRDCFYEVKDFGTSVFGVNGTQADLCFGRRQHPQVNIQASFTNVKGCLEEAELRVNFIRDQRFDSFTSDSLFLFESSIDDDDFDRSVNAWMEFLKPLLQDELERDLVASVLAEGRGTRLDKTSQKSKVYNYWHVKKALAGILDWERLLHD